MNARAEVPLDKVTLEVALVLDNTGSMGSASKLVYLKQAANQLITKLENATVVNFTSYVALVPFTTQVRLFEGDLWTAIPGVRLNHTKDAAEPALQVALPWRGCIADPDQPNDAQGYEASDGVPLNTGAPARCFLPSGASGRAFGLWFRSRATSRPCTRASTPWSPTEIPTARSACRQALRF